MRFNHQCPRCGIEWSNDREKYTVCPNPNCVIEEMFSPPETPPAEVKTTPAFKERFSVEARKSRRSSSFDYEYIPRKDSKERNHKVYNAVRKMEIPSAVPMLKMALSERGYKTHRNRRGRPPIHLDDRVIFCVQKVLRGVSCLDSDEFNGYVVGSRMVKQPIHPNTVSDIMNDPALTPILQELVSITALPFIPMEHLAAIDGSGFGAPGTRWVQVRLDKKKHKDYVKLHVIIGIESHAILGAIVTPANANDSPQFVPLLKAAADEFNLKEVTADAAYPSRENATVAHILGIKPYIDLKRSTRLDVYGSHPWDKMVCSFRDYTQDYLYHYHNRSQVEAVFSMLKRRIADGIRSKTYIAQTNELYCLCIAHNLLLCTRFAAIMSLKLNFKRKKK